MSLFNFTGSGVPLDALLLDIAEKLKDARAKMGWSQKTLADAAGIDRAYVGSVERGKQNFTFGGLKKITDALTKSIFDLIGQGAKSLSTSKQQQFQTSRPRFCLPPPGLLT